MIIPPAFNREKEKNVSPDRSIPSKNLTPVMSYEQQMNAFVTKLSLPIGRCHSSTGGQSKKANDKPIREKIGWI